MKNFFYFFLTLFFFSSLYGAPAPKKGPKYDIPPASTPVPLKTSTEVLKQMQASLIAIAEETKKALVFVSISKTVKEQMMGDPFEFFFGQGPRSRGELPPQIQKGLGSGFFIEIEKNGYIVTNNHVVDDADEIEVKLANGKSYPAKVLGKDPNTDVAVVEIIDKKFDRTGLGALVLGDSNTLQVGAIVMALGAPFGLESSVSTGNVSAIKRGSMEITRLGDFIQTDAAINPGHSGGPLVGIDGKAYGMNTAIFSRTGANNGIAFTVPANLVREIASSLINEGTVTGGFLGVEIQSLKEEYAEVLGLPKGTSGVMIARVAPDSPAKKAGIVENDILTEINDERIKGDNEFVSVIGLTKPGTTLSLTVYREGSKKKIPVVVGAFPTTNEIASDSPKGEKQAKAENSFGLTIAKITPSLKKQYGFESRTGLVVTKVEANSPAAQARISEGFVILAINGQRVNDPEVFNKFLKKQQGLILLHIEKEGEYFFVPVRKK